jgi:Protein of unknown function (DUF4231)
VTANREPRQRAADAPAPAAANKDSRPARRHVRRPALLARFPKPLWWRLDPAQRWQDDWPVIPVDADSGHPLLASDLRVWRDEYEVRFRDLDHRAQLLQQQFWRQQVTLIIGGLLATVLGTYQAARGGGNAPIAAVQAVVTGFLTGLAALVRSRRSQQSYLTARLKAERMKSEFFLFLARVDAYTGDGREDRLRHQVEDLAEAEGVQ